MTAPPTPLGTRLFRHAGTLLAVACGVGITLIVQRGPNKSVGEHAEHDEKRGGEHAVEGREHGEAEHGERVEMSDEAKKNAKLEIVPAAGGKVVSSIQVPGEVTLDQEALAHVTPRVSGTVREVRKQLGDDVKKGDVLAVLDSKELAEFSRDARAASERVKIAEANFKRIEKLYEDKIVPEKDYLAAKQALTEATLERDAAAQTLVAAGAPGGKPQYNLVAPLDGTIIEKHCSIGEVLKDDTRTFVIADLSRVWVEMQIFPKDLAEVEIGQSVRVTVAGIDEPAYGKVNYIGAVAATSARSVTARAVLENPAGKWKPGLFIAAEIGVGEEQADVIVEDEAILTVEGKRVVFVEEGGAFEARPVKTGRFGRDTSGKTVVEITSGVAKGDRYVKNAFVLKAELGKSEAGHDH